MLPSLIERLAEGPFTMDDYAFLAAIIGGGAVTNAFVQWKAARDAKTPFDPVDFLIAIVIAIFAGTMFAIGSAYFSTDPLVQHGVSGAGAFLGLSGLNKMTDVLLDVLTQRAKRVGGEP